MPFDAHIHLDHYDPEQQQDMLGAAWAAGVEGVVSVSMDMASCEANRRLTLQYPGRVFAAYGYHPEQDPLTAAGLEWMCGWIAELPRVVPYAIGEVGLPYFRRKEAEASGKGFDHAPYLRQLERFVRLAAELDRPLALHAVHEDADTVMDLLERYGTRQAHFHWFKGSPATTARLIAGGYFISVTPEVLYDEETRELARTYPMEQLMVETDGPWPFEGPFAGRSTEPRMVMDSVKEIAALRGIPEEKTARILGENTRRFYRLPGTE
jgi:TatD DNase family protein